MAKTKEQKKKVFEELKENIARQKTVIFIDFTGLKVKDMFDLRKNLKKADSQLKVAKKTLIQLAFKESGLKTDVKKIKGEIALVFGYKDEISPAKAIYQFSKENPNLKILGGFFENKFREAEDFITLAQIPSKEELLARLAGSLSAPVTNFVRALEYNLKGLVYVLSKLKI
ncbi:MAG: 50S ribosomal protein L10 [Candidatus Nealsonbacteria bacterium]